MNNMISRKKLDSIIARIPDVRVCVFGDICLDMYLYADMRQSRLSRETPHYPLPVVREMCSPGGGGNVMSNVKALGAQLSAVSALGRDWRAFLLKNCFVQRGIDTNGLIEADDFVTPAYLKPMRMGISDVIYEDPRLDFENRSVPGAKDEDAIISGLRNAAEECDIIAVADQLRCGVVTERVVAELEAIARCKPVVIDSRDRLSRFAGKGMILKPNEVEAAYLLKRDSVPQQISECVRLGENIRTQNGAPVILTLGENGAVWCGADTVSHIATVKAEPPIDIVGCGDTFLSAFCCAYAAGASGEEAIAFANLASSVTVKKLGTTGTAEPHEIIAKYEEASI